MAAEGLGGCFKTFPSASWKTRPLKEVDPSFFSADGKEMSSTMAIVRMLTALLKDPQVLFRLQLHLPWRIPFQNPTPHVMLSMFLAKQ